MKRPRHVLHAIKHSQQGAAIVAPAIKLANFAKETLRVTLVFAFAKNKMHITYVSWIMAIITLTHL